MGADKSLGAAGERRSYLLPARWPSAVRRWTKTQTCDTVLAINIGNNSPARSQTFIGTHATNGGVNALSRACADGHRPRAAQPLRARATAACALPTARRPFPRVLPPVLRGPLPKTRCTPGVPRGTLAVRLR